MPADEWIAMRTCLSEEPEVIGIAARLGMDVDLVVGKLHRVWSWADKRTSNGRIANTDYARLDVIARAQGFSDAMASENWLSRDEDGTIVFPRWGTYNPKSAKKRKLAAHRQARKRKRDKRGRVTRTSRTKRDGHEATKQPQNKRNTEDPVQSNQSARTSPPALHGADAEKTGRARWGEVDWAGQQFVRDALIALRIWPVIVDDVVTWEPPATIEEVRRICEWVRSDKGARDPAALFVYRLYNERGILDSMPKGRAGTDWERVRSRVVARLKSMNAARGNA